MQTNGVYCPIESELILLLIEGSWVEASYSPFSSPVDQSCMSLCLQQPWWQFLWSLAWIFRSAHPNCSYNLPLYPPSLESGSFFLILVQLLKYWFASLDCFESLIGHQNLSHFLALSLFLLMLPDCLSTILALTLSFDTWILTPNQDRHQKTSSNTGRFILDFVVDSSAKIIIKSQKKRRNLRVHMQLIQI